MRDACVVNIQYRVKTMKHVIDGYIVKTIIEIIVKTKFNNFVTLNYHICNRSSKVYISQLKSIGKLIFQAIFKSLL